VLDRGADAEVEAEPDRSSGFKGAYPVDGFAKGFAETGGVPDISVFEEGVGRSYGNIVYGTVTDLAYWNRQVTVVLYFE
jgi:hypothetical protein